MTVGFVVRRIVVILKQMQDRYRSCRMCCGTYPSCATSSSLQLDSPPSLNVMLGKSVSLSERHEGL